MNSGDVEERVGKEGVHVGVAIMWQSPVYSSVEMIGILASVKIKGEACA